MSGRQGKGQFGEAPHSSTAHSRLTVGRLTWRLHFFQQTLQDSFGGTEDSPWYAIQGRWELRTDFLSWEVGTAHKGGQAVCPPSGESPCEILIIFLFGRGRGLGSSLKHPWCPLSYHPSYGLSFHLRKVAQSPSGTDFGDLGCDVSRWDYLSWSFSWQAALLAPPDAELFYGETIPLCYWGSWGWPHVGHTWLVSGLSKNLRLTSWEEWLY